MFRMYSLSLTAINRASHCILLCSQFSILESAVVTPFMGMTNSSLCLQSIHIFIFYKGEYSGKNTVHMHRYSVHMYRYIVLMHRYIVHMHRYTVHMHRYRVHMHRYTVHMHRYTLHMHRYTLHMHRYTVHRHTVHVYMQGNTLYSIQLPSEVLQSSHYIIMTSSDQGL